MHYFLARNFEKEFKKLPKKIKGKAIEQFEIFIVDPMDPRLNNHALVGEWIGHRSINITSDIRALYKIVDGNVARFVTIGSHSELYE
ncbi:MAG: type II toxin-antitoxin system mRNA interferase toxin, RelE/StbE family [bacterium]|nr:type II toxin-antitoxin system mRNA interferase toxin, RelE/StbE family [bacterium]